MKNATIWFGGVFTVVLTGLFSVFLFGAGTSVRAWTAIVAGVVIFAAGTYHKWSSSVEGRTVPSPATITPEEALDLSPGDLIRDGNDVLTVRTAERDPRQSSGTGVVVVATDENGTERRLPIGSPSRESVPQSPLSREHLAAQNVVRNRERVPRSREEQSSVSIADKRPQW